MHTRAALIVLSRIVLVFPTQPKTGDKVLETLAPLQSDENTRPDIRATAQGYCSQLMKARDDGMWKEENIAVTKARQEREKMKAEERKKKLAKQHEDLKKESEMISRQLGEGGRGDQSWRFDRRDDRGGRPRTMDPRMDPRMHPRVSDIVAQFCEFIFASSCSHLYLVLVGYISRAHPL
jgi:THO complex subunit 2